FSRRSPRRSPALAFPPWERKLVAAERQTAVTSNKAHGRIETRTLTRSTALQDYVDWPDLAQAFKLVRQRTLRGKTSTETVYGITSLPPDRADADTLLRLTRQHWCIANRVFYVRDVTFGEDHCRVRTGSAPVILSALRNIAINLLNARHVTNKAAALRRHAARPYEALALIRTKGDY
ncbi:MAG: ISAs1 family transposase, partial [Planctomycetes bacterium]|nr:ISAs1 family transposase [Planctomycetota bacterium]